MSTIATPTTALDFTCPRCNAEPQSPCTSKDGKEVKFFHRPRLALASPETEAKPAKPRAKRGRPKKVVIPEPKSAEVTVDWLLDLAQELNNISNVYQPQSASLTFEENGTLVTATFSDNSWKLALSA